MDRTPVLVRVKETSIGIYYDGEGDYQSVVGVHAFTNEIVYIRFTDGHPMHYEMFFPNEYHLFWKEDVRPQGRFEDPDGWQFEPYFMRPRAPRILDPKPWIWYPGETIL